MPDFEVGDLFAKRYEIVKELGRGGMGMVYLVKDQKTHRRRALKTLLPKYAANKQAVRRFAREVKASRRIDHPCVVKIYDAGEVDKILYYTMEYIEGKSVRAWMRERKKKTGKAIGLGSTVRILSMLCSALEQAHKFTIHRDLSPENVMVTRDGTVKLLDFGLAKLDSTDADLTRIGVSLGKTQYSAPEQRVDAKNVDHRADIYSLGVMFYELLSGELPTDSTPLTRRVRGLPPEVDTFVDRCMAERPQDRFGSAAEVRRALKLIFEHAKGMQEEAKHGAGRSRKAAGPASSGSPAAEVVSSIEAKRSAKLVVPGKRESAALPRERRERPRGRLGRLWRRLFRRPKL
ncbi:MAG: serine/threonine protein kinase [Candidatus Hydrogenedentes bacterium]|nr:serine/threonine protein kinase [Candidatus Hydrogenedentota bacterium]